MRICMSMRGFGRQADGQKFVVVNLGYVSTYTNSEVAVQRCYIIIAVIKILDTFTKISGVKSAKLEKEYL